MSAHNFWDSFNIGFLNGMFNGNSFLGCSMPFQGGCGFYNSVFTPLSSMLLPFQSDSFMYMTPNAFSSMSIFPLMSNNMAMPSFENFTMDINKIFPTDNWRMPALGDTFTSLNPSVSNSDTLPSVSERKKNKPEASDLSDSSDSPEAAGRSDAKLTSNSVNDKYFDKMLSYILSLEGGYSNVSGDRGGKTYKGVTQATYNSYRKNNKLKTRDVRQMTDAEMKEIYYGIYKACGADKIDNPRMALMVFDVAVNSGPARAKKMFKESGGSISKFEELRRKLYTNIANNNSSQKKFLKGWNNRVDNTHDFAMAELPDRSSTA